MSTPRNRTATAKAETNKEEVAETQSAVTKTTDLADTAKDNSAVAETKVEETPKAPEKSIDELVEEEVQKRLANLKAESKEITDMTVKDGHITSIKTQDTAEVAEIAEKEVKKVKIKFIKNHSMYINTDKHDAKEGDILMVERHIANKLVGRHLAYILG